MWKKSASVESLHTFGGTATGGGGSGSTLMYLTEEEREALKSSYVRANSVRVSRSRGCNESFRQAVDRSYERDMPGEITSSRSNGLMCHVVEKNTSSLEH